jgi:hypothetical protein
LERITSQAINFALQNEVGRAQHPKEPGEDGCFECEAFFDFGKVSTKALTVVKSMAILGPLEGGARQRTPLKMESNIVHSSGELLICTPRRTQRR